MNIDRISNFMTEPVHLLGLLFLIVAGTSLCTGKTITRGQGLVSRAKEPKTFWFIVGVFFLGGIVFLGTKIN
jgi:formate/nitrite transporter FocA (FNT family)